MKYISIIILLIISNINAYSQTQQGIVKTRGRMIDGQLVPGIKLEGAAITLSFGNPHVSDDEGSFYFAVPSSKTYSLVSAVKNGYILSDSDYTNRIFSFSDKEPFYVVLEDENQRLAEINKATRDLQKKMNEELNKKDNELEEQRNLNKITEEEYQRKIKELYDSQDKAQQLVKLMAERYATTDYDQLDEFNRQVQSYIEKGELIKADSMIQSKGSLDQRIDEYHRATKANEIERERLEKSEAATKKNYKELSSDLLNEYSIAIQQLQWKEAMDYLKKRADLDTTNIEAVFDYAFMCDEQLKIDESLAYYNICKNRICSIHDTIPISSYSTLANIHSNIGKLYFIQTELDLAESELLISLEYRYECFKSNFVRKSDRYNIIRTLSQLGQLYNLERKYDLAEQRFQEALDICEQFSDFNDNELISKSELLNSYSSCYIAQEKYDLAEPIVNKALALSKDLANNNPEKYNRKYLTTISVAFLLFAQKQNKDLIDLYSKEADNIIQKLEIEKHNANSHIITIFKYRQGISYYVLGDYTAADKYLTQAMNLFRQLQKDYPYSYNFELLNCLHFLGIIKNEQGEQHLAENYYRQEINLCSELLANEGTNYNTDIARNGLANIMSQLLGDNYSLALQYFQSGLQDQNNNNNILAEKNYNKALELFSQINIDAERQGSSSMGNMIKLFIAEIHANLGTIYIRLNQIEQAEKQYLTASSVYHELPVEFLEPYHHELIAVCEYLAEFYYEMQKYEESEKFMIETYEYYRIQNQKDPNLYNSKIGDLAYKISEIYNKLDNMDKSEEYLQISYNFYNLLISNQKHDCYYDLAFTCYKMAHIFKNTEKYKQAEEKFQESLNLLSKLEIAEQNKHISLIGEINNNLGILYLYDLSNEEQAENHLLKSRNIYLKLTQENFVEYASSYVVVSFQIGILYFEKEKLNKAEKYINDVLITIQKLYEKDPQKYYLLAPDIYNLLGHLYEEQSKNELAEEYFLKEIELYQTLAINSEQNYTILAEKKKEYGRYEWYNEKYNIAEQSLLDAVNIYQELIIDQPDKYKPYLAESYYYLGLIYDQVDSLTNAETYYLRSLNLYKELCISDSEKYTSKLESDLEGIAEILYKKNEYEIAIKYKEESLDIPKNLSGYNQAWKHEDLAIYLIMNSQFEKAEYYTNLALNIEPERELAEVYACLAILLQGRYNEAEEIAKRIITRIYYDDITLGDKLLERLNEIETKKIIPEQRSGDVQKLRKIITH